MASGRAFVLQLLLFSAIGQLLCVTSSLMGDSTKSTETIKRGGITASLIHRDQYFADDTNLLTYREKREQDARRSKLRVESLVNKRRLAAIATAIPASAPLGDADWETPLSDVDSAEYLMEISLGTPAQSFIAIADTGSDLTWLQCPLCQGCSISTIFQPANSSTYAPLPCSSTTCSNFLNGTGLGCNPSTSCNYKLEYGDGSTTSGTIAQDTITLQTVTGVNQTVANFSFGCSGKVVSNDTGLFSVANGIVGLGRGDISFPSQLGAYFGNKFGYCLVNRSISNTVAYSSPLFFGSDAVPAPQATGATLQYTPMINSPTYYLVGCDGISLNGIRISEIDADAFKNGVIFDSGTTFTTLQAPIFVPFIGAIGKQLTKYIRFTAETDYPLCYKASWSDWVNDDSVPTISFQFSHTFGFNLSVDTAWIDHEIDGTKAVCLAMFATNSNINIFGNYQQVGYHVLYDSENAQIGFVQASCNATSTGVPLAGVSSGTSLVTGLFLPLSLLLLVMGQFFH